MRTLKSELIDKGLHKAFKQQTARKNIVTRDKPQERLSDRDWAELMGTNRPTYARGKGGAFRQR